jgi:hypothetical protein
LVFGFLFQAQQTNPELSARSNQRQTHFTLGKRSKISVEIRLISGLFQSIPLT